MTEQQGFDQSKTETTLEGTWLGYLAGQSPLQYFALLIAIGVVAFMAAAHVPAIWPTLWVGVIAIHMLIRHQLVVKAPTDNHAAQRSRVRTITFMACMQGLYYAASALFFPYFSPVEQAITTMIIVSLCSGMITATYGYPVKVHQHVTVPLFSLALAWMFFGNDIEPSWANEGSALLVMLYLLFLNGSRQDAYKLFSESYRTRQQQAELNEQLQQALETAETANRAKTRFLASASHDLRQPIHTLSIFSAALDLKDLNPEIREITDNMDSALQNLATQLDALLDISKLDAGVIQANSKDIKLAPLVEQLSKECKPLCKEKNLQFTVSSDASISIHSDPALLERILRNLLFNAIKYTQTGSIEIKANVDGDHCLLEIIDTGKGIPQAEQNRVFEEFYQLDNPERDRSKGLGLGLAIVRRLLSLLDINMTLESAPDSGTHFTLSIPLAQQQQSKPVAVTPSNGIEIENKCVMVIDDEIAVREAMKTLIEAMGCEAAIADSSKDALAKAKQRLPDIVLADFRLRGDDDGIKAIQSIRQLAPSMPALLISGDTAPERLRQAHDADIALLHKPVEINSLRNAMAAAIAKSK